MLKKYFIFFFIFLFFIVFNFSNLHDTSVFYFPTNYLTITSEYGYRELYGAKNYHNGVDFGAPQGSNIYSISSGVVIYTGFLNGYGNTVIIKHENEIKSLYAHIDENFLVSVGDYICDSQLIAKVGPKYLSNGLQNGNTTGPHLHLTIFNKDNNTIDPMSINFLE